MQVYHSQMLKLLYVTFANKITAWLTTCFLWKLSMMVMSSSVLVPAHLRSEWLFRLCSGKPIIFVLYFKASCIPSVLHVSQCVDTVELYVSSTLVNVGKDRRCN